MRDGCMGESTVKYCDFVDSEYSSVNRIVRLIPANKTVLDVGCSTGYLGRLLREKGCTVYGIELNEKAAEEAGQIYRDVWIMDLDDFAGLKGRDASFDIIVFGDILEHLKDPCRLLQKMRTFLRDDGSVIVSLPNVANWSMRFHLLRGKFDYVPYGILDESHLKFFHLRSARELIEEAGFEVVRMDFTPGVDKLVPYRMFVQPLFKNFRGYKACEYRLTKIWPTLFAHQMIFVAVKRQDD
jgi:methionine biosynthesis protein MetW